MSEFQKSPVKTPDSKIIELQNSEESPPPVPPHKISYQPNSAISVQRSLGQSATLPHPRSNVSPNSTVLRPQRNTLPNQIVRANSPASSGYDTSFNSSETKHQAQQASFDTGVACKSPPNTVGVPICNKAPPLPLHGPPTRSPTRYSVRGYFSPAFQNDIPVSSNNISPLGTLFSKTSVHNGTMSLMRPNKGPVIRQEMVHGSLHAHSPLHPLVRPTCNHSTVFRQLFKANSHPPPHQLTQSYPPKPISMHHTLPSHSHHMNASSCTSCLPRFPPNVSIPHSHGSRFQSNGALPPHKIIANCGIKHTASTKDWNATPPIPCNNVQHSQIPFSNCSNGHCIQSQLCFPSQSHQEFLIQNAVSPYYSSQNATQVQSIPTNIPPAPPLPPPVVLPPDTFEDLKYICLPHKVLVPPPPQQQQVPNFPEEVILGCPEHGHHHVSANQRLEYSSQGAELGSRERSIYGDLDRWNGVPQSPIEQQRPFPMQNKLLKRPQAVSQSAIMDSPRRMHKTVDDCGRWGRINQGQNGQYELSQDLLDKRTEMLERRYGGSKSRRAAIVIQRAYRHYSMRKKFRSITDFVKAQQEKRLSRRVTIESLDWGADTHYQLTHKADYDHWNCNGKPMACTPDRRRPGRSMSLRDPERLIFTKDRKTSVNDQNGLYNDSALYCRSPHDFALPDGNICNHGAPNSSQIASRLNSGHSGSYICARNASPISTHPVAYVCDQDLDHKLGIPPPRDFAGVSRNLTPPPLREFAGVHNKNISKKKPPDLPSRNSSVKSDNSDRDNSYLKDNRDNYSLKDNISLSSVPSSGSESSLSQITDRANTPSKDDHDFLPPLSPIWKRKKGVPVLLLEPPHIEDKRLSNISENSEDSFPSSASYEGQSHCGNRSINYNNQSGNYSNHSNQSINYKNQSINYSHRKITKSQRNNSYPRDSKSSEIIRKRQYRVGLNLFNKKPEKGIQYLIQKSFLDDSPKDVAKFLLTRKGLSKQMIGEFLGNLQNNFNMSVLDFFANEIDLCNMDLDVALRKFQTYFRMPGEAQKIERLMQVFAQRYTECNRELVDEFRDHDTIFVLAFAVIMLNTDLHTASLKPEKRMKPEEFVRNLRGIDDGADIDKDLLERMYERIKAQEFRSGSDHVTQVLKVQQTISGKKPVLCLPHRRLVCYCRLYEVPDPARKERPGQHQREVFLFNDLLVVTKILSKKKNSVSYSFRKSFALAGLTVVTHESPHHSFLLEIRQRVDNKTLIILNARNGHDRSKFCEDLKESILEMDEMENLRIGAEFERQRANLRASRPNSSTESRDSGVADLELLEKLHKEVTPENTMKRTTLSNSLIDIHESTNGI